MASLAELAAEAMNAGDGEEDVEKQLEQALACPCIGDLKEGPCGPSFVEAFSCYVRSTHEDKGMDCLSQFGAFQECLKKHPDHVEKIMSDAESELESGEHTDGANNSANAPNSVVQEVQNTAATIPAR